MTTAVKENCSWSPWYDIDNQEAKDALPMTPGVYQVRTDFEIGRLKGSSRIVSIGSAAPSLRQGLREQRFHKTARWKYLDRAEKWLLHGGHTLEFRYLTTDDEKEARFLEDEYLLEYECEHWELPPGNERSPLPKIRKELEQKRVGKLAEGFIRDLLEQNWSPDEIARLLGTAKENIPDQSSLGI
jgi:hypothetical protein